LNGSVLCISSCWKNSSPSFSSSSFFSSSSSLSCSSSSSSFFFLCVGGVNGTFVLLKFDGSLLTPCYIIDSVHIQSGYDIISLTYNPNRNYIYGLGINNIIYGVEITNEGLKKPVKLFVHEEGVDGDEDGDGVCNM
jgi:hypothetical protein